MARRIRELRYAVAVEKDHSKDEILERYLNLAYFGDGVYGVEAAAEHYFSTSAAQLDLRKRPCWPDSCEPRRAPTRSLTPTPPLLAVTWC